MRHFGEAFIAVVVLSAIAITPVRAESFNDKAALSGMNEVKVAFDVTNGDGKALLKQLDVIDETRREDQTRRYQ